MEKNEQLSKQKLREYFKMPVFRDLGDFEEDRYGKYSKNNMGIYANMKATKNEEYEWYIKALRAVDKMTAEIRAIN